jgi:hypothetical protein
MVEGADQKEAVGRRHPLHAACLAGIEIGGGHSVVDFCFLDQLG